MTNKYLHIGPGGKRCACCFPAPGSKERHKQFRRAKRKQARNHWMLELSAMDNTNAVIELLDKKPALFVASNESVQFIEPRTLKYTKE